MRYMRHIRHGLALILFASLMLATLAAMAWQPASLAAQDAKQEAKKNDPTRWEKDIAKFEAMDKEKPQKKGQVLFVGSSSIRMWKLDKSFPGLDAINRGFGGSQIEDSTHFADRIVLPYEPRTIVVYAGDNDLHSGKTPEVVAKDFELFATKVRAKLPKVKIVFIAIKPSVARWKNVANVRKANAMIAKQCEAGEAMVFVDIDKPMMGEDGKPRAELLVADGLHLSEAGYALWTGLVKPHVE